MQHKISRRRFNASIAITAATGAFPGSTRGVQVEPTAPRAPTEFSLNYILASCMYGYEKIETILPQVGKIGATAIDIWPKPHGNQREQLDEIGEQKLASLLKKHHVRLGCVTQYKLGPFGLQNEMRLAHRLDCELLVCGGKGPANLSGPELKAGVKHFVEQMKPHLEIAKQTEVTIAIENHGNNLIMSPDSLKWLVELCPDRHLGIALAPYHLEQDSTKIAELIKALGNRISVFYAWQHGMGCMNKLPKEQELLQMPGRGALDFNPILAALKQIEFDGWTEIFMHPVPRGIPIMDSTEEVSAEINKSCDYLTNCLQATTHL